MAATITRMCRPAFSQQHSLIINQRLRSSSRHVRLFHRGDVRHLFTNEALKVDMYVNGREKAARRFQNMEDKFRDRIKFYLDHPEKNIIFTEDLKNMVYLLQNKSEDIDLYLRMLQKFSTQNQDMRFGTFVFGPVIMRSLHYLNLPDVAYNLLMDKDLREFFNQLSSYIIAMNLLYKNKQYERMKDVFEALKELQLFGSKYHRDGMLLVLAACYHLNTPEYYKYALDLMTEARKVNSYISRKTFSFLAALAIKQKDPSTALELLMSSSPEHIIVKNLQVMAFADLDRLDSVFANIKQVIYDDRPNYDSKQQLCQEAIEKVKQAAERSENKDHIHEFKKLEKSLQDGGHISTETVEAFLCTPIAPSVGVKTFTRNERFLKQRNLIKEDEI